MRGLWLEVGVLIYVEAWTRFVAEHVVSYDVCLGILFLQPHQQFTQGFLLCVGTCIGRLPVLVESAFVADAYGVFVVVEAVRPYHFDWATVLNRAIPTDHVVVPDSVLPSSGEMPLVDLVGGACL